MLLPMIKNLKERREYEHQTENKDFDIISNIIIGGFIKSYTWIMNQIQHLHWRIDIQSNLNPRQMGELISHSCISSILDIAQTYWGLVLAAPLDNEQI